MKKILFYPVVLLLCLFSLLPFWLMYGISDIMYFLIYYVVGYRKKTVFDNLRKSFPDKDEKEIKQIGKRFFRHLCDLMVETVKLISISPKTYRRRTTVKGVETLNQYYDKGQSVILSMAHYCNWEWGVGFPFYVKHQMLAAYRPLDNKDFDNLFKRIRRKFGCIVVRMQDTARKMIESTRNNEKVMLLLIADQSPAYGDVQHFVTFLGQKTPVFMGPEKMSKRFDIPLFYLEINKPKRGHYELIFSLLSDEPKKTQPFELTKLFYHKLEEQIYRKPEYWLWSHKRWKYAHKEVVESKQMADN